MYNRDDILRDLRDSVIEITFDKVNGQERVMRCSLNPVVLPPSYKEDINEEKKFHAENKDVIAAWSIDDNGWRSFRVDSVKYIQDVSRNY